jgi:cytochrome P450
LVPDETFANHYEDLLSFAEQLESEIMSMIRDRRAAGRYGRDVLSILVQSHDEQGGLSDEELVGQASVLFSAAHMTTAHALTWTMFLLAQHPSIMQRLWEEFAAGKSAEFEGADLGSLPKGEDLSLLDRVIKESLRLLPASAYSQRINVVPAQLGPLSLPRGTGIVFTPLVVHRLPELYPEPDRFLPDRWIGLRPSPYAYHPFGAGLRLCIGGPLALAIMRITLRRVLERFKLTVTPGAEISAHVASTMLCPTNGLPMCIDAPDGEFSSSPIGGNIHELVDLVEAPITTSDEASANDVAPLATIAPRKPR